MHLVGYLYEDYHDARSLEHKVTASQAFICEVTSQTTVRSSDLYFRISVQPSSTIDPQWESNPFL
jgi:hypothetical protein